MRILITGATGFIGARAVRALAEEHDVVAVARGSQQEVDGVEWVSLDLSELDGSDGLPPSLDAIVHLAQSPRYRDFPAGVEDVFSVNLASTAQLLEHARGCGARKFVLASTGGVYGRGALARESDPISPAPPGPLAFYLNSKLSAELIVASYGDFLEPVILRPFFVYGPGQHLMLVRILAERILSGETVTVHGEVGMRVNPIHVTDTVEAIRASLAPGSSGIFNLAGDEIVTITELISLIGELAGREPRIEHVAGEQGDMVADTTRLRDELGVAQQTPLREGLRALLSSLQ